MQTKTDFQSLVRRVKTEMAKNGFSKSAQDFIRETDRRMVFFKSLPSYIIWKNSDHQFLKDSFEVSDEKDPS